MIQLKIIDSATTSASRQPRITATLDQLILRSCAQAAAMLRMLILTLVGLLFVLLGLMILTGRVEVGGPIMVGVLLAGLGAAQFARPGNTRTPE